MPDEPNQQSNLRSFAEIDEWDPWGESGPLLRAESFTARQLFYLTPEAIHLESRRQFIGNYPPQWVEENCLPWMQSVEKLVETLHGRDQNGMTSSQRNFHRLRRLNDLELATEIARETDYSLRDHSSRRQRLIRQMRRRRNRFREDMLETSNQSHEAHASSEDQNNVLTSEEADNGGSEEAFREPQGNTNTTSSVQSASGSKDKASLNPDGSDETNTTLTNDYPSAGAVPNNGGLRGSTSIASGSTIFFDCNSQPRPNIIRASSSGTLNSDVSPASSSSSVESFIDGKFYDTTDTRDSFSTARSRIYTETNRNERNINDIGSLREQSFLWPPGPDDSARSVPNNTISNGGSFQTVSGDLNLQGKNGNLGKQKTTQNVPSNISSQSEAQTSLARTGESSDAPPSFPSHVTSSTPNIPPYTEGPSVLSKHQREQKPGKRHHVSFRPTKFNAKPVYQGHFLVQERRSSSKHPVVDELQAPLATHMVSRWKEVALMAQKTDDVDKPLILYFYSTSTKERMSLKAKSKWTRRVEYKVVLDKHYEMALFSPLDLTLAIWRPRISGKHLFRRSGHRNHEYDGNNGLNYTQVLIIHSQSIVEVMDLAYLVASATSAAPNLHGHLSLDIGVPALGVKAQVNAYRSVQDAINQMRETSYKEAFISYEDIQKPVVGANKSLTSTMKEVWKLICQIPEEKRAANTLKGTHKYAMGWILNGIPHRPLWIPSSSTSLYPLTRLNWLLGQKTKLVMVKPEPKCFIGDYIEPAPVEGYCGRISIFLNKKCSKNIGRSSSNYLWTCDQYFMCCPANVAVPPMLASGFNSLVKPVEPYSLDDTKSIRWIKNSTCLHELDHHDAIAEIERDRLVSLVSESHGLVDLTHYNSFEVNSQGNLEIRGILNNTHNIFVFDDATVAEAWSQRLKEISTFWRRKLNALSLQRVSSSGHCDFTITPYLHNRAIVYSGPLFLKGHRFAVFKSYHVVLTPKELVIYRVDQSHRAPAQPSESIPSASLIYRRYMSIDLRYTYIYTGQVASHCLLDIDNHRDPSKPGVRALPRAYENGWVSQDTELDRCFVTWRASKRHLAKMMAVGTGVYVAFLAQQKEERDKWVTAIRYVQSALGLKCQEVQNQEDQYQEDTEPFDDDEP